MKNVSSLHIVTNNIRGIQNKYKCLSIIDHLKHKKAKNEFYFYNKHIQIPVTNKNGRTNSVDPLFIDTVLLTLVVY